MGKKRNPHFNYTKNYKEKNRVIKILGYTIKVEVKTYVIMLNTNVKKFA